MSRKAKARSKFSVVDLVVDHFDTLRNYSTGKFSIGDLLVYLGLPVACATAVGIAGLRVGNLPELLAAVAILTGLIFNVFVLLFDLTMRAADRTDPAKLRDIMKLAGELRANISYAVLSGITMTAVIGGFVMLSGEKELPIVPTIVVVFGLAQMLLTIFMVLKRVRGLYRAFLTSLPDPETTTIR